MSEVKANKISPASSTVVTLGDSSDTFVVTTGAKLDINGTELILDADADTSITADTDDQIDIKIAGADDFQFTANTFTVLSGSTLAVASGATIANSGTSTGFSASTLAAATTVGDGTAEDTKIVFDGNAQDYYIGLDDTDDDLKIGLGSAVGTTAHMVFNEAGEITKPLQPAFLVHPASNQTNLALNSGVVIVFGTERFDVGANFASNTFTAPVTGKYILSFNLYMEDFDTAATYYQANLVTSNRTYYDTVTPGTWSATENFYHLRVAIVADMDVSDTAYVSLWQSGGTQQTDITSNASFSGALLC